MIAQLATRFSLGATVVAAMVAAGCSPAPAAKTTSTSSALSSSVAVDFYRGSMLTGACSGTLLAPNVVLTSRHCSTGGNAVRVTAPGAGGATTTAARIFRYAWDPNSDASVQHDFAVLVLRSPIRLKTYPTLQAESCYGCSVAAVQREPQRTTVKWTKTSRLAAMPTLANPLALYTTVAPTDSGGAVYRTATGGKAILVGLTLGRSRTGAGGYVSRIDDPDVYTWLGGAMSYASSALGRSSAGSLKTQDDEPSSDPSNDPSDPPSDPGSSSSGSDPSPPASDPTQSPAAPTDNGPTPTAPSDDSVDQGGSPTAGAPSTDNPPQPTDDAAAGGDGTDTAGLSTTPRVVNMPVFGCPADTSCTSETATPGGGLCNLSFAPNEEVGKNFQGYCNGSNSGASVVGCHGAPGITLGCFDDPVSLGTMGSRANDDGQKIIMASCNGGTINEEAEPGDQGFSNAAAVANQANTAPTNVYGCCGGLVTGSQGLECGGAWCDGAGNGLQEAERSKYNLRNCKMTSTTCANGNPGCVSLEFCN